jgi:hypothetical protein
MRLVKLITVALVTTVITLMLGCATVKDSDVPAVYLAAGADVATTSIALSNGAHELNPLGFWGTTLMKVVYLSRRSSLDADTRASYDRMATSVWTGAAANNLLQIIAPKPILYSLTVGIWVGYSIYTADTEP